MDFRKALQATTKEERDRLVEEEWIIHCWEDELSDQMQKGGWPDDAQVIDCDIQEDDERITATVILDFAESVPSSCKDVNYEHKGEATYVVSIDRATGDYEVEIDEGADISDGFDMDDAADELYFPGDYR